MNCDPEAPTTDELEHGVWAGNLSENRLKRQAGLACCRRAAGRPCRGGEKLRAKSFISHLVRKKWQRFHKLVASQEQASDLGRGDENIGL